VWLLGKRAGKKSFPHPKEKPLKERELGPLPTTSLQLRNNKLLKRQTGSGGD